MLPFLIFNWNRSKREGNSGQRVENFVEWCSRVSESALPTLNKSI